ncbi:MAG: leucine-rich repeat protein [Muribaculaceae bacterium]|nr:leucine-rich repeat protein [Muribaculaceae bacterium]
MKLLKSISVMALAFGAALLADAQRFESDGISYVIDQPGKASVVLGDTYYSGKITIPAEAGGATVAGIGFGAFNACHGLSGVELPATIGVIGDYAFNACDSLTAINLPQSLTRVGDFAFHGCSRILDIALPESVTYIGSEAFFGCTAMRTVTVGKNVTEIGGRAFQRCTQLKTITVDPENPNYCDIDGILMSKDAKTLITFCRKNASWRGYTMPSSVTDISPFAFYGCDAMKTIELPEGLEAIGEWAFGDCSIMGTFTLPKSVTHIGANAFFGMKNCKTFYCQTIEPLPLSELRSPFGMFTDLSARTLYVPNGDAVRLYKAAPVWKEFGNIVAYLGDINGDGVVNVSDVTALVNMILGEAEYDQKACDINCDGVVNVSDVTALINTILE